MSKLSAKGLNRISVLFALSICLMSCTNWVLDNPSFTLRKVSFSPISFTEIKLLLDLDVQNPNHFDLKLKSFEYTVYLKNEEIGNGRLEKELLIPSSSTTQNQQHRYRCLSLQNLRI
jgi:LEA14-like dessication related protein